METSILDKYCAYIEWSERYDLHKISQEELGTNFKYFSLEELNNMLSRIEAINSILYQSTIMRTVDKYAKEYLDLGYIYKGDLEQWKTDFRETLDCEFWQNNNIVNTFGDKSYQFNKFELAFFGYHKTKFSILDKKNGNIVFTERWDIGNGRCGKGSFLNELKDLDLSKETIASFYNSYDTCKGFDDFKAVFSELAKTKIEDILTKEDYDLIHVYKWKINKQINRLECIKSKKNLIDNLKQRTHQKTASQTKSYSKKAKNLIVIRERGFMNDIVQQANQVLYELKKQEYYADHVIDYVLQNRYTKRISVVMSSKEGESQVYWSGNVGEKINKESFQYVEWTYNFDDFLFSELDSCNIVSMSMSTHYNLWCTVDNDYSYYKYNNVGIDKYMDFCRKINISKRILDCKLGLDVPDLFDKVFVPQKEKNKTRQTKSYSSATRDPIAGNKQVANDNPNNTSIDKQR